MINVLKHGDKYVEKTCPYCGCQFSFSEVDLEIETYNLGRILNNHQANGFTYVKCPECNRKVVKEEF